MAEHVDILISRLRAVRQNIISDGIEVAKATALNQKALVVRRIQSEGIPGERYSDKGVPAFLVEKSSYARLNSGFDKMIADRKKTHESVAWKDIREAQGLQTGFVDYTFTGRTFQNLTIVDTRIDGTTAYADLGGSDQETRDKLSWGYDRYGDFLAPNDEEKRILLQTVEEELKKNIDKYALI